MSSPFVVVGGVLLKEALRIVSYPDNSASRTVTGHTVRMLFKNIKKCWFSLERGEVPLFKTSNIFENDDKMLKNIHLENNTPKKIDYRELLKKKNFELYDYVGADEIYFNKTYFNFPS